MQSEDAKYLKRKLRPLSIDVHPTEIALIVNYELEALILGDLGDPLLGDKKECQKIIRLRSLKHDTDVKALARQVVEQCSLIHTSKIAEVEQHIYYLQNRAKDASSGGRGTSRDRENSSRPSSSSGKESPGSKNSEFSPDKANINHIERYVELLYEDIQEKVTGSSCILQLARNPDNLQELGNNESVLSALSRVLREDWKKNILLSTNIIYIFFCFSTYSQFHHIILQYKIGSLCMEIIHYELKRLDQWKDDVEFRRKKLEEFANQVPESVEPRRVSMIPVAAGDRGRRKFGDGNTSQVQSPVTTPGDPKEEYRKKKEDLDRIIGKFNNLIKKQDQLLRVSFYLLLNIAEDIRVEDKMRKKNIVGMLIKTLDRDNIDLLVLVTTFLKKLSLFRENIESMLEECIVDKLPRLLLIDNPDLTDASLELIFNLSFDTLLRDKMIRVGFLPKLVNLLATGEQRHETEVLKILYHFSIDDKCKSMFSYTDCVPVVMKMILESPEDEDIGYELISLGINLALNKRNAQMMVEDGQLQQMIARAFKTQSSLLMKMIRNIAQHDCTKQNFIEFVGDIAKAITQCENEDFVLECIGVLGNMTLPDLDFSQLLQRFNLIPWILNVLVPGKYDDDLVLDVVVLLGTAAADEGCATLLCKADVLLALIELLKAKQEDDEMVLQIIYVFYEVSRHNATRDYLVSGTEVPAYLLDLMHDKSPQIRKVCNVCLDIIAKCNKDWTERIKMERFRWHNSQWLEMVENNALASSGVSFSSSNAMDNDLPSYMNEDLMRHTMLFPTSSHLGLDDSDNFGSDTSRSDTIVRPKSSRYSCDLDAKIEAYSKHLSASCTNLLLDSTKNFSEQSVAGAHYVNI